MHKLLIADDEPSLRLLVAATLASEDYDIIEAGDGAEALKLAKAERPKLALLDVNMPIMNGLEVCRLIKSDPDLSSTAVVMLTSASQPSEREAGFAAGANEYLTKPFSPIQLLRVIEQFVS
jgi:two-component system, OmpR family, phosphate regulon response regulator PhoB